MWCTGPRRRYRSDFHRFDAAAATPENSAAAVNRRSTTSFAFVIDEENAPVSQKVLGISSSLVEQVVDEHANEHALYGPK